MLGPLAGTRVNLPLSCYAAGKSIEYVSDTELTLGLGDSGGGGRFHALKGVSAMPCERYPHSNLSNQEDLVTKPTLDLGLGGFEATNQHPRPASRGPPKGNPMDVGLPTGPASGAIESGGVFRPSGVRKMVRWGKLPAFLDGYLG